MLREQEQKTKLKTHEKSFSTVKFSESLFWLFEIRSLEFCVSAALNFIYEISAVIKIV